MTYVFDCLILPNMLIFATNSFQPASLTATLFDLQDLSIEWGMILKWALRNIMGVNWINAHEVPVFAGSVVLCRKSENGYWEFQGEALC